MILDHFQDHQNNDLLILIWNDLIQHSVDNRTEPNLPEYRSFSLVLFGSVQWDPKIPNIPLNTTANILSDNTFPKYILSNLEKFEEYILWYIGEVAEWLKAHAWKACKEAILSWVRIPFSPPLNKLYFTGVI